MKRLYEIMLANHLEHDRQMIFLAGPRQVGKTTISRITKTLTQVFVYLNWDYEEDRHLILRGPEAIVKKYDLNKTLQQKAIIAFDEIHKYKKWRNYLKGFYDKHNERIHFVVTGSSKLDIYRSAGDSLMGRYFPYRVHPLSVAELLDLVLRDEEIQEPKELNAKDFKTLIQLGGFPEPFCKGTKQFYNRWIKLRTEQLFNLDIRELTRIQEIAQMKYLALLLKERATHLANFNNLAKLVRVTSDTIRSWVNTLNSFYYCYQIQPWSKNITRSLIKQPKLYLWDWSEIKEIGARHENFVASHLLKAIHWWEDQGLGSYGLYYLRDKEKREVDFLVVKNDQPWFLVEVKTSHKQSVSEQLHYFQRQTQATHAFQVVFDLPYEEVNCFDYHEPIIVSALTFLSQLV